MTQLSIVFERILDSIQKVFSNLFGWIIAVFTAYLSWLGDDSGSILLVIVALVWDKNWLFCGNDASAYRAAIVYSLISSCQSAGVDPREWMEDVLCKLPYYNRDGRDLTELLPKDWAASRQHVTE